MIIICKSRIYFPLGSEKSENGNLNNWCMFQVSTTKPFSITQRTPRYEIRCINARNYILDSERSDECIDFTMLYVFFLCVCVSITSRNNASISNFGDGFRWKSEYPWCIIEVKSKHLPTDFKKIEKNKKKITEKREFLRKTSFRPNRFFLYGCNSKNNHCKYLKFSPNVYELHYKETNTKFLCTCIKKMNFKLLTKVEKEFQTTINRKLCFTGLYTLNLFYNIIKYQSNYRSYA
ncbi:hypothetical protein AGLY_006990 [Aphis glycines]|uniref:Uncharacterized protein n=1 Tax=Aphis glycines TaxID=307491 RepID=A0A6G0TQK6_APHGL|nr:hypothetical protein AGLY_006990 [Aphis glycines]